MDSEGNVVYTGSKSQSQTQQPMESQLEPLIESQLESQMDSQFEFESQTQSQFQTQSQTINETTKKHYIPNIYGVYLLNSLSKKTCYYVGSTPDPYRRLRQHNGELSRGGAYRTKKKGYRPWRMVIYIYGFPSKISALQFEHAWQHSYQTRHIPFEKRLTPGVKHSGSGTNIHAKIANCKLLLNSSSFRRLGLKVAIFNNSIYDVWLKNKYGIIIPQDLQIDVRISTENLDDSIILGGNYNQLKHFIDSNLSFQNKYLEKCNTIYLKDPNDSKICRICKSNVNIENGLNTLCVCTYDECECIYHMKCLADNFLNDGNDNNSDNNNNSNNNNKNNDKIEIERQLLPIKGKCIGCNKINFWNLIVRGAINLQEKYGDI